MAVTSSDIAIYLSGGEYNVDSNMSFGGVQSNQLVTASLFSDISKTDAVSGTTDYRCVYIENLNQVDNMENTTIGVVTPDAATDSTTSVGLFLQKEIQTIIINGAVSGGNFVLEYCDVFAISGPVCYLISVDYDATLSVWSGNLQTALQNCGAFGFSDVIVSASGTASSTIFTITFSSYRQFELLAVYDNSLVGSPSIDIIKSQNGSPINTVADFVESSSSAPPSVTFSDSFSLGTIRCVETVPLWIKRVLSAEAAAREDDGFTLRISCD